MTAKRCFELSQALVNEEGKPLQHLVQGHTAWRSLELWDNVLRLSIEEEIHQQERYGLGNLSAEEVTARMQNSVFCQLGSFVGVLQTYKVELKYAGELIHRYAFKYQLELNDCNTLEAILNKCYADPSVPEEADVVGVVRGVPGWMQDLEGHEKDLHRRIENPSRDYLKEEVAEAEEPIEIQKLEEAESDKPHRGDEVAEAEEDKNENPEVTSDFGGKVTGETQENRLPSGFLEVVSDEESSDKLSSPAIEGRDSAEQGISPS